MDPAKKDKPSNHGAAAAAASAAADRIEKQQKQLLLASTGGTDDDDPTRIMSAGLGGGGGGGGGSDSRETTTAAPLIIEKDQKGLLLASTGTAAAADRPNTTLREAEEEETSTSPGTIPFAEQFSDGCPVPPPPSPLACGIGIVAARSSTTPGAYRHDPLQGSSQLLTVGQPTHLDTTNPRSSLSTPSTAAAAYNNGPSNNTNNENNDSSSNAHGLVEARAVGDEEQPAAVALPESNDENKRTDDSPKPKGWLVKLAPLLVFGMAIVLLILGLTGTFQRNDDSKEENGAPSQPEQATTALSPEDILWQNLFGDLPASDLTIQALEDPTSPQSKAWDWIQQDPNIQRYVHSRLIQRYSLATFYYAMNGTFWNKNTNWLHYDVHECEWYLTSSISIVGRPTEHDSACHNYTAFGVPHINTTTLEQQSNPTSLLVENHLYTRLWLRKNRIHGTLPDQLYWLTSLTSIMLSYNNEGGIGGTISTSIAKLSKLEELRIPHDVYFSRGKQRKDWLQGTLPSQIGLLTNLRLIDLGRAGHWLNGTLPLELFTQLTNLQQLSLAGNRFTGSLPTEIGLLSNVFVFTTSSNQFTGTIPSQLGRMTSLAYAYFYWNMFSGTLPTQVGLLTNSVWLEFWDNHLNGSIPTQIGLHTKLQDFELSNNDMTGTIPSEIRAMVALKKLFLDQNHLTGSIPSEVGLLSASLVDLGLDGNSLSGRIPSDVGMLSILNRAWFRNNSLTGVIPLELNGLVSNGSLALMVLEENNLSGVVPESLCDLGQEANSTHGLSFDCHDDSLLCGCDWCSCNSNNTL